MPTSSKPADPKPEPRRRDSSRHDAEFYGHNMMIFHIKKSPEEAAKKPEA